MMLINIFMMVTPVDIGLLLLLSIGWWFWSKRNWAAISSLPIGYAHLLFAAHLAFTLFYYAYTFYSSTDAWEYYHDPSFRGNASNWIGLYDTGISFIFFIVYPLSQVLGLSYLSSFFLFSALGFLGFIYMLRLWEVVFPKWYTLSQKWEKYLLLLIFFWPSLHFWTVAIGKDSLSFLAIALFFWCLSDAKKRGVGLFMALLLMLHIRPHMALLLLGSAVLAYFIHARLQGNWTIKQSLILLLVLLLLPVFTWWLLPKVDVFELSLQGIKDSLVAMQHRFVDTTHGLDLRELSVPERYFTFLFRPMPGDSQQLLGYALIAQNILLLVVSLTALGFWIKRPHWPGSMLTWAMLFYFFFGTFIFSQALSNLGLIEREKMMFLLPWAYFFSFMLLGRKGPIGKGSQSET